MSSTARKRPKHRDRAPTSPLDISRGPPSSLFPSKRELLRLAAVVAIAASVAVTCNYAAGVLSRRPKPFCDSGDAFQDLDFCEPCPGNGECSKGELECFHGYKRHGKICIEDGEINQMAQKYSEWVQQYVCEAYSRILCDETGKIWKFLFQDAEILEILHDHNLEETTVFRDETFILAKNKAMDIVESFLETKEIPDGKREFKCPDMVAELHKPLLCCIRQWIHRNILLLATYLVLLVCLVKFLWTVRRKRYLTRRADQLYEQVCEILEDNAMMAKSTNKEGDPSIVASWLRDHLLLPRERRDATLWKKVEELVLEDSRIDQYPKLIKGESKIVFEWQVEGSLSSKKRPKKSASPEKFGSAIRNLFSLQRRATVCEPQN